MSRPWLSCAIVAAAALSAAVTGCGGSTPAPPGPASTAPASTAPGTAARQRVTIEGNTSLRFVPMTVHVHTGTVRITLKDIGAYPHNLVIPGLHVTSPTVTGDPGGTTTRFTVTFPHAGRYPFHCQYHQSAGMTGMFVVS
jgi:plastocyanin